MCVGNFILWIHWSLSLVSFWLHFTSFCFWRSNLINSSLFFSARIRERFWNSLGLEARHFTTILRIISPVCEAVSLLIRPKIAKVRYLPTDSIFTKILQIKLGLELFYRQNTAREVLGKFKIKMLRQETLRVSPARRSPAPGLSLSGGLRPSTSLTLHVALRGEVSKLTSVGSLQLIGGEEQAPLLNIMKGRGLLAKPGGRFPSSLGGLRSERSSDLRPSSLGELLPPLGGGVPLTRRTFGPTYAPPGRERWASSPRGSATVGPSGQLRPDSTGGCFATEKIIRAAL